MLGIMLVLVEEAFFILAPVEILVSSIFIELFNLLIVFLGNLLVGHEVVMDGIVLIFVKEAIVFFAPH